MIGDSKTDILPAKVLGMESMLVLSGEGEKYKNSFYEKEKPDYISKNLMFGAIELIT
jgi:ribonucleotide monophosphatase NagD (HAD superfamily)